MKRIMVCLVALMIATSSAWAWDEGYHVKQAPNKEGDLMIFPMFMAAGDWETKIIVTNTSDTYSVVAKVIYRSHYWTKELLDHLIYLSPNDVWVGYIRDIGGNPSIYSEDDSILVTESAFATPANPVRQPFVNEKLCQDDSRDRGYVEVIETWYHATASPISKADLHDMYHHSTGPVANAENSNVAGYLAGPPVVNSNAIDHTINVLTGEMEFRNRNVPAYTASMNATVFADFDNKSYMGVTAISGLDSVDAYNNTLGEVEAALAKNSVAMHYVNNVESGIGTIHMFNFPTKQSYQWNTAASRCDYQPKGPFWQQYRDANTNALDQCLVYSRAFYDLSENDGAGSSPIYSGSDIPDEEMCEELQWVAIYGSTYFNEGWQRYTFQPGDPTFFRPARYAAIAAASNTYWGWGSGTVTGDDYAYTGVPVIPFSLYLNLNTPAMSMVEGASIDGNVYASWDVVTNTATAGSWLPDYQYWNYMDALGLNNSAGNSNNATANAPAWYPSVGDAAPPTLTVLPVPFPQQ